MKKINLIALLILLGYCVSSQNPLINEPNSFTADPSPHQWEENGRLYMYCTYDVVGSSNETEWHVFSTNDLKTWTDHGKALDLENISWAKSKAWAPDCARKNGKYYFFFPASKGDGQGMSTGVAVSDSPTGPFKEAIGKPLMDRAHDPCIFEDEDGQYYLYTQTNVVKMGDDMITLAHEPKKLELVGKEIPDRHEAVWVFKRKGIYYWIIAEGWNEFTYWTGDNPYGPFTYRGVMMPSPMKGNNHPGIIKYNGKWIIFYHNYFTNKNGETARRICAEEIHFNEDGTIQPVLMSRDGVQFEEQESVEPEKQHKLGLYEMDTPWAKDLTRNNPLPEYPRPIMQRDDWMNLNGVWEFQEAYEGEGIPSAKKLNEQIVVPFAWESKLSGINRQLESQRAWYRRKFEIPENWRGQRILLNFGAVDFEASVYINQKFAGNHKGGFDSFSFDITPYLTDKGSQEIAVMVFDPGNDEGIAVGKQSNDRFSAPGRYAYSPASGIWQTVWLEPVPDLHINDLHIVPDIDQEKITVTIDPASQKDYAKVLISVWDSGVEVNTVQGELNQPIEINIPDPKLWSPSSPFLYDVKVKLEDGNQIADEVTSYVGMRKIALGEGPKGLKKLFLNNEFVFQMGPLDQGYWPDGIYTAPTDEALKWDIETMKEFGYNMVRKHIKIEPQRWYYWCDKLGLLVWQDMPSTFKKRTEQEKTQFETELAQMVKKHWNHPSIVNWIVFNEHWGIYDPVRLTENVMALDPSRLVTGNSGIDAGKPNMDYVVGHICDNHSYRPPNVPFASQIRATVCGEYGAIGYKVNGHIWDVDGPWVHHNYNGIDDATAEYERFINMILRFKVEGLSAAVYTQWTDLENEMNGIFTYDRKISKFYNDRILKANQSTYLNEP